MSRPGRTFTSTPLGHRAHNNGPSAIWSGWWSMNEQLPLDFRELATLGRWIVNGPRSLVTLGESTGGKHGWLDRAMHWKKHPIAGGVHESCTVYRRFEFEGAELPSYVVRFAHWDSGKDREACKAGTSQQISVAVRHFVFPEERMESIRVREERLAACVAATHTSGRRPSVSPTMVYHWDFPGVLISQSLHWWSSSQTELLEQLWEDTIPKETGLEAFPELIERFDVETFGEHLDVRLEQLVTVHHLI
jgi:hypothetical protein